MQPQVFRKDLTIFCGFYTLAQLNFSFQNKDTVCIKIFQNPLMYYGYFILFIQRSNQNSIIMAVFCVSLL